MRAFLDMGGYAPFVWPAYALTLAVMGLNVLWARQLLKRSRKEAKRRLTMRTEARQEEVAP
jgi:heme exporter protein CcmD